MAGHGGVGGFVRTAPAATWPDRWQPDDECGGDDTGAHVVALVDPGSGSGGGGPIAYRLEAWAYDAGNPSGSEAKERFVYHQAGLGGWGSSSYIDSVMLRDRDANTGWGAASDGTMEERVYYAQNWRHDVSALITDDGRMIEWVKYSSYGVPMSLPAGDTDSDGDFDSTDAAAITGTYDVRKDVNLDGTVDVVDYLDALDLNGGFSTQGWSILSNRKWNNRKGYAGYEGDTVLAGTKWHVRHRVLESDLGRWLKRDPIGYIDGGSLYSYTRNWPITFVDTYGLTISTVCSGNRIAGSCSTSPLIPVIQIIDCITRGSFSSCYSCCQGQGSACIDMCMAAYPYVTPPSPGGPNPGTQEKACDVSCSRNRNNPGVQTCADGKVVACVCTENPISDNPGHPPATDDFRQQMNRCVGLQELLIQGGGDCTDKQDGDDPSYPDPRTDQKGACAFMRMKHAALQAARSCISSITCPSDPPNGNVACTEQRDRELENVDQGIASWGRAVAACARAGY
jgi:RHS repeat-associated protein